MSDDDDNNDDDDDDDDMMMMMMMIIIIIKLMIINLIYIAQFDTIGILTAMYIVITYIEMQSVHV